MDSSLHPLPEEFDSNKWLCGVGFSVMDNRKGPQIICQVPSGILLADDFNQISNSIICETIPNINTITFLHGKYYIMGCPIKIEDKHYTRNSFLFNVFFMLESAIQTNSSHLRIFKSISTTIALHMRQVESKTKILSSYNEDINRKKILQILQGLYESLMRNKSHFIFEHDGKPTPNSFVLSWRTTSNTPKLSGAAVPLFLKKPRDTAFCFDENGSKIAPHINGSNDLNKIATESSIPLNNVIATVESLIHVCKVVAVIPHYSEHSRFTWGPNFNEIFHNDDVRIGITEYCSHQPTNTITSNYNNESFICILHLLSNVVSTSIPMNHLKNFVSKDQLSIINLKALIDYSLACQIVAVESGYQVEIHPCHANSNTNQNHHFNYRIRSDEHSGLKSTSLVSQKNHTHTSSSITNLFI